MRISRVSIFAGVGLCFFLAPAISSAAGSVGQYADSHASGDFNGDGRTDYVRGTPQALANSGEIHILYAMPMGPR